MKRWFNSLLLALFLCTTIGDGFALAQSEENYKPTVGQEGKDVIWVPTPQALVEKMLDVAGVTPKDYVIDLGSGDGRTVIAAAKRGARALGIEYNPDMVELSKRNAAKEGVSDKVAFVKADLFESDFSQATVITMFLLADINLKLRPRILNLAPGTRVVSNNFTMGAWSADQIVTAEDDCALYCVAYFWIVPAKVEGVWQLDGGELTLIQTFQMVSGTFRSGANNLQVVDGRLEGNRITFTAGDDKYVGRVSGNVMEGVSAGGNWKASRADH